MKCFTFNYFPFFCPLPNEVQRGLRNGLRTYVRTSVLPSGVFPDNISKNVQCMSTKFYIGLLLVLPRAGFMKLFQIK